MARAMAGQAISRWLALSALALSSIITDPKPEWPTAALLP
jgi:hypothetical protein